MPPSSIIKKPEELGSMTPQQIAEEIWRWAEIFLEGTGNPNGLHKENRENINAMIAFLKALIKQAATSGKTSYPLSSLNGAIAKLNYIKGELARYYNKEKTPSEKVLKKIPELYGELVNLSSQYRKISS